MVRRYGWEGLSMKWYSDKSQIAWACDALISGNEISHADEILAVNGWRLAAIVHILKHRYKWPIAVRYDAKRIAHYRLEGDAEKLKKPRSYIAATKAKKEWEAATSHSQKPETCHNQPPRN